MNLHIDNDPIIHEYHDIKVIDNFLSESDFKNMNEILKNILVQKTDSLRIYHTSVGVHPYSVAHYSASLTDHIFFNEYLFQKISETLNMNFKIKRIYTSLQTYHQHGNFHIDDNSIDNYTVTFYTAFSNFGDTADNDLTSYFKKLNIIDDYKYNFDCESYKSNIYFAPMYAEDNEEVRKQKEKNVKRICDSLNKNNFDGHFYIKVPQRNYITQIPFVPNRLCAFNSVYAHNGECFNENLNYIRLVISYKLEKV